MEEKVQKINAFNFWNVKHGQQCNYCNSFRPHKIVAKYKVLNFKHKKDFSEKMQNIGHFPNGL